ncbi:MAG: zinc-ribbon domain-containing protein [Oscillospiraceae bacterium]|nr:zinc-ribbon domain-containing protein [Oscillospiraceae bacterium]
MSDVNKIINNLKAGASVIANEAETLTRNVISKSSDIADRAKINFAIREIENRLNDAYLFIGKCVYEQAKNGAEFSDDIREKCGFIDGCTDEINALKKDLAASKSTVLCPQCGNYAAETSKFCPECGAKLI